MFFQQLINTEKSKESTKTIQSLFLMHLEISESTLLNLETKREWLELSKLVEDSTQEMMWCRQFLKI